MAANLLNEYGIYLALTGWIAGFICVIPYLMVRGQKKNREGMIYLNNKTGVWNFTRLRMELDKVLKKARISDGYVIVHIDIKDYKYVNDIYGFSVGNRMLSRVALEIKKARRVGEYYCQLWGDHFLWLMKCDSQQELRDRVKTLFQRTEKEIINSFEYRVVMRAGAYLLTEYDLLEIKEGRDIDEVIQLANHALNSIHEVYRSQICIFDDSIHREIEGIKTADGKKLKALREGEFVPFYQPKYDINTGEILGAEALVRWIKKDGQSIPPSEFLPYFEQSGFITELDFYIFEETCKYLRKWLDRGHKPVCISCNFSRLHLQDENFAKNIVKIVEGYSLPRDCVEVEITETVMIRELEVMEKQLEVFHDAGIRVAVDDFGKGFTSLSLFTQLNVDVLKLDKSMIDHITESEKVRLLVAGIIKIADRLGIEVVCEGIESREQADALNKMGCRTVQGYYFAKPMPARNFAIMAANQEGTSEL